MGACIVSASIAKYHDDQHVYLSDSAHRLEAVFDEKWKELPLSVPESKLVVIHSYIFPDMVIQMPCLLNESEQVVLLPALYVPRRSRLLPNRI